eukprot:7805703-Ditylum_brightwellii.AAC.1
MNELFARFENIMAYIDDLLSIIKETYEEHPEKLNKVLKKLEKAGLKVNINKSFFAQQELEYLGYWITQSSIMPLAKKLAAIQEIQLPKYKKQLRGFIGIIVLYRYMWKGRTERLVLLTKLCSKNQQWKWTDTEQKVFEDTKKTVAKNTLLICHDFNKPFEIHSDASQYQLGATISQGGMPNAFFSRKLSSAQLNYTTTEK